MSELSRQRRWQIKRASQGLCILCGSNKAVPGSSLCAEHIEKQRGYMRKKYGCRPHRQGGCGRPPRIISNPTH